MMRQMNRLIALLVLLVAATLETGGDALVRAGIRTPAPWTRFGFYWRARWFCFFMPGPSILRLGTSAVS
jgi:hypothetical protein